jgi:hypothetical protein
MHHFIIERIDGMRVFCTAATCSVILAFEIRLQDMKEGGMNHFLYR